MHILTFDIEEWFHLLDHPDTRTEAQWSNFESRIHSNMDKIFSLFEENNTRATFFCIGWVARKYPEVVKRISDAGFEIATHSDLHQLAFEQNRETYRQDLERSIKSLEDVIGKKVKAYRAPGFSVGESNKWIFEMLVENGIEIDCSIFPAKRAHGGFESFGVAEPCYIDIEGHRLKEFPINLYSMGPGKLIFSGGGYFRLFPYQLLKRMFGNSPYVMTYFHPRDFDFEQPMLPNLSLMRKFKSYYGLKACLPKLARVINDFKLIDLQEADRIVDWSKAPIKQL